MADEFICDARKLGSFIGKVKEIAAGGGATSAEARLAAIRPLFSRLTGQLGACIDLPPFGANWTRGIPPESEQTANPVQTTPFRGEKAVLQ